MNIAAPYEEILSITIYIKWKNYKGVSAKQFLGKNYVTLEDALKTFLVFDEMIFINKAKLMYKIASDRAPTKPKLNIFKISLPYSGALVWNRIPTDIKSADTLSSFVLKCSNWLKEWNASSSKGYCNAITSNANSKSILYVCKCLYNLICLVSLKFVTSFPLSFHFDSCIKEHNCEFSFIMTFMNRAFGEFHKYHMEWLRV